MVYSSVAEERHHALQPGWALNSRPVTGQTCRMMVTGECRLATLLTRSRSQVSAQAAIISPAQRPPSQSLFRTLRQHVRQSSEAKNRLC